MTIQIGGMEAAKEWLTSEKWLVFGFEGDFCQFLEYNYFEPGTRRNAEFETLMLPVEGGLSFWFRIRDTRENRENLKKALGRDYRRDFIFPGLVMLVIGKAKIYV